MQKDDQWNLVLAVALMLGFLFIYDNFVLAPQRRAAIEAQSKVQAQQVQQAPVASQFQVLPRDQVIAQDNTAQTRVPLDAPSIDGSISLKGARIDDVSLKGYYETIEAKLAQNKSAEVHLMEPQQTERAFYAMVNWVGAPGLPTENSVWTQSSTGPLTPQTPLVLTWSGEGVTIERTITVDDGFMFTVADKLTNSGAAPLTAQPVAVIRQNQLADHLKPPPNAHAGVVGVYDDRTNQMRKYKDLAKGKGVLEEVQKGWIALTTKYWMAAVIPEQGDPVAMRASVDSANGRVVYQAGFTGSTFTLQPGEQLVKSTRVFAGAKRVALLDQYQKAGIPAFTDAVDWSWLFFITKPFFWLLKLFQGWLGSFGLAILAATVVVKLALLPVQMQTYTSMARMRKVMPEMKAIQERFAADKVRQQQEVMKFYQREKINPLSGCLPIIPIMIVSIALYQVLMVTLDMRHTPFPGVSWLPESWVKDMSAPDPTTIFNLFGLLPYDPTKIPFIGSFLKIGVWPILYGATMWALQGMSAPVTDPTQKMIMQWMPLIFLFLFSGVAAGLAIYWTWSNLITMVQQYFIMRKLGVETSFDTFLNKHVFKPKAAAE